ncbi:MAG: acetolactate synthase small subunit [Methanobacteriaceae archaeon]|nr:acetolactate synthase small subunit [Methanobacteriaceae archaeon]MDD3408305.1 acetolactate synthase small subunit [Methanobacteriaceae archaeon]MDD4593922.1 acetolactate synthase small subunit [Methanobacteriaceae archaeon]
MNDYDDSNQFHIISTLVEDKPGVLQKVSSLFTRRGFNIESITVGRSEVSNLSRMVIIVKGDYKVLEQVIKQLNKLVDVVKVKDLEHNHSVSRELCLIKVKSEDEKSKLEIMQYVNIFRAKVIDICDNSLIIEVTGDVGKINALINLLKSHGIKKIARTGSTAMARGNY